MMGFSTCNNSDIFQCPKLVSIGGICIEPFSCLHQFEVGFQGQWSGDWGTICHTIVGKDILDVLGLVNEEGASSNVLLDSNPKYP